MITISSAYAGEIDTAEDLTISEDLSIDNGDAINLDEELEDNAILTSNEELEDNEIVGEGENSEVTGNNITPSGNSFTDIQNAINSAGEGDNIILNGTYYQDSYNVISMGNDAVFATSIDVNKSVNIIGINDATLQGVKLTDPYFKQFGLMTILANGVVLKNITFCDGLAISKDGSLQSNSAGSIFCDDYSFSIDNCRFLNSEDTDGDWSAGALKLFDSDCNVSNCYFYNNKGSRGGVFLIEGNSQVKFYNTTFEDNHASTFGGAVCVIDEAKADFTNCSFISNAAANGGAIYAESDVSILNCSFANNTANDGGAIELAFTTSVKICNSSFELNNATGCGGAVFARMEYVDPSYARYCEDTSFENCTFVNNSASYGGAVFARDCINTSFENCSIVNNSASTYGGAIDIDQGSYSVFNCSFENNSANESAGAFWINATGSVENCSFVNNSANNLAGGAIWSDANVSIVNCSFEKNTALWEGAVRMGMGSVINCSFVNNSATSGHGAIRIDNGSVLDCNFEKNTAGNGSGALYSSGNLIVKNCTFLNNVDMGHGGALSTWGNLTVENSSFINNSAKNYGRGGAIYAYGSKNIIQNCSFVNNSAERGGAIGGGTASVINCTIENSNSLSTGGAIHLDRSTIVNCSFINCSSSSVGGAIYSTYYGNIANCSFINCSSSIAGAIRLNISSIKNCSFENCSAATMGGALWISCDGNIDNSTFVNNDATVSGGAIYINDGVNSYKISNCNFDNNSIINESQGDYRFGGAIYCLGKTCEIINSNFNNNTSPDAGGAIYVSENTTQIDISDCKFNDNFVSNEFSGVNRGGGAICSLSNGLNIYKCNFISNLAEISFGGAVRLINPENGVFNSSIKRSAFISNDALDGKAVYTDDGAILQLNSFKFNVGENKNEIVYGLSMDNLTGEYNTFTESKLNSSISPTNKTFVFGEAIVIPISSENVNNITVTILDGNYQVVFTKDDVVANGEFVVPSLAAGTYTINYVANVIGDMFNPSYAGSRLTIDKAKSSVSGTAVTTYHGKTFSVKVSSDNATSIKYVIKNSAGKQVKSGSISPGASITGLSFVPGTYTLTLTTVVDGNYTSSSASSKITVNKATGNITASALTTYYNSGKTWSITLKDKTNGKVLASKKLTLKVYTGSKYKTYTVKTNSKGVATFKASTLAPGSHKVVVSYSNSNYTTKSLTKTLKINKMTLSYKVSKSTQKDGAGLHVWVKNKATGKLINKIKIKLLVYTGKKYKTITLVSAKYSNKGNGYTGYAVKGPVYSVGTHTVKIMAGDSYHTGSVKSKLVLKSTVKKYSKKTIIISKGKRTIK